MYPLWNTLSVHRALLVVLFKNQNLRNGKNEYSQKVSKTEKRWTKQVDGSQQTLQVTKRGYKGGPFIQDSPTCESSLSNTRICASQHAILY